MRTLQRGLFDKLFTGCAYVAVLVMVAVLLVVLVPVFQRGSSAVVFRETIEFRKLQRDMHSRGDIDALKAEQQQVQQLRNEVYSTIDAFKSAVDTGALQQQAEAIFQEFNEHLRQSDIPRGQYFALRIVSERIRDTLLETFETGSPDQAEQLLDSVMAYADDQRFVGTPAEQYVELAKDFRQTLEHIDLSRQRAYLSDVQRLEQIVRKMFGPRPGEPVPASRIERYGATRWDMARQELDNFLYTEQWVETEPGQPLQKVTTPRKATFEQTPLYDLFGYVEHNYASFFNPRWRVYWQYFIDDSTSGRYFGGVGPEILGTLLLTVIGMIVVVPLGVISAAYLVECAGDNWLVRIIRMGINTLAGVPSIVFGLFGMAFFMLFLFPALGLTSRPSILAGSLTLSILTLPVMIRASEEAIRAVPAAYKEASLALGASDFRTFITVIFPAALPGILTGVILSLSRVAGETAPILFTAAIALGPVPTSIMEPTRALSYGTYDMAVGDRIAMLVPHQQFGMVMTLILLVLLLNALSIALRAHVFKKLQGR